MPHADRPFRASKAPGLAFTECCRSQISMACTLVGSAGSLAGRILGFGERIHGPGRRRVLAPGSGRVPRVPRSALGPGKPSADDLLLAFRSIRLYEGRSGKRIVIFGVDIDRDDPSGDGEVIFHGQWKGQR
jgi:hypothetical protein